VSVIALALWLAAATPAPAPPAPPRTGPVSVLIRSETFKRAFKDKPQSFRVDYTASLTWSLKDRKACFFSHCGAVCDLIVSHKVLSRQIWWTPPEKAAVLAENNVNQREYYGGVVTFGRPCAAVSDSQVAHGASDRLRPYQFADEVIKDRPLLLKSADDYLALNPPP
jgi:hypothetical protein